MQPGRNVPLLRNARLWRRIPDDSRCHDTHKSHKSATLPTSLSPILVAVRMSPSSSAHTLTLCGYSEALLLYGLFRSMSVAVEVTSTLTNSEHWPSFACPPSMSDMRPVPKLNTLILVTCRQQVPGYRQSDSFGHDAESLQNPRRLKYIPKACLVINTISIYIRPQINTQLIHSHLAHELFHIFVNCNWAVTRWQYTFTHKQYIEQYKTNNT